MQVSFPGRKGEPHAISTMRVHYLKHVPYEGLGAIEPWLAARGAEVTESRMYEAREDPALPRIRDLDWLLVMGGPMSAWEVDRHPWLPAERRWIADAVSAGKTVVGICLGAQLLAGALEADVFPNPVREIGWFPVEPVDSAGGGDPIPPPLTRTLDAFHWHGDTFDLPRGATHIARSEGCSNQAFQYGSHVLGLQFHLEMMPAGAEALIDNCRDDLSPGPWVQAGQEMVRDSGRFERANDAMVELLEWLASEDA